jgi:hypothetical protein
MSLQLEIFFDGPVPMGARSDLLDRERNLPHGFEIVPISGRNYLARARRAWKMSNFRRAVGQRIQEVNFRHYQQTSTHLPTFELDVKRPKTAASWPGAELDFTAHGLPLQVANRLIRDLGECSFVEQIDIDHLDTMVYVIVVRFRGDQHMSSEAPLQAYLHALTRDWLDDNGHDRTGFTIRAPRS